MRYILAFLLAMISGQAQAECKHYFEETTQCMTKGEYSVLRDVVISETRIKQIRTQNSPFVASGCDQAIFYELYGLINDDAFYALKTLFESQPHCGRTSVLLFSAGGYLDDGLKIAEYLAIRDTHTMVISTASCSSSCAVVFLGGKYRSMLGSAKLMFHAPYYKLSHGIKCVKSAPALKSFYQRRLGQISGERLFEKTMSKCSDEDGWTINEDAARIYDILTQ